MIVCSELSQTAHAWKFSRLRDALFNKSRLRGRSHCAIRNCDLLLLTMGCIEASEVTAAQCEHFHRVQYNPLVATWGIAVAIRNKSEKNARALSGRKKRTKVNLNARQQMLKLYFNLNVSGKNQLKCIAFKICGEDNLLDFWTSNDHVFLENIQFLYML